MEALITLFLFCQALGALIGALTAIWSELAYIRALRDGKIDAAEQAHLRVIAQGLRFGMSLLLLASFGLVVAAYVLHTALQPALTASYWTLVVLAILVIVITWALSRKRISFALGSAALFTAWWFLVYLSFGWIPPLSFGAAVSLYVVLAAIFYALFNYIRLLASPKQY